MSNSRSHVFDLPEAWSEEARSFLEGDHVRRASPRWAASVILLRDGVDGVEIFLAAHPASSPLGRLGFLGGPVLDADEEPVPWVGPSAAQWMKALGLDDEATARRLVTGAVRIVAERSGVLLAAPAPANSGLAGGSGARPIDASSDDEFARTLRERGLAIDTTLLRPLSRWITPEFMLRRFRTQFFAVVAPPDQDAAAKPGTWGRWCTPAELLGDGPPLGDEIGMPETVGKTFREIAAPPVQILAHKLANANCTISYVSEKRPVLEFEPQLVEDNGVLRLKIDGLPSAARPAVRSF